MADSLHFPLVIHKSGSQSKAATRSDSRNANPSFLFTCSSRSLDGYANTGPPPPPPAPLIPSAQTAFASPPGGPMSPMAGLAGYAPPLPTLSGAHAAPPPPGPPPPPLPAGASHLTTRKMSSSAPAETAAVNDARSDLLAAIRMGKGLSPPGCPSQGRGGTARWLRFFFFIFSQASS